MKKIIFLAWAALAIAACNKKEQPPKEAPAPETAAKQPIGEDGQVMEFDAETGVYTLLGGGKIRLAGVKRPDQAAFSRCPELVDELKKIVESHLIRSDLLFSKRVPHQIIYRGAGADVPLVDIRFPAWQAAKFRGKTDAESGKAVGAGKFLSFNKTLLFQGLAVLDETTIPADDADDYREAWRRGQKTGQGIHAEKCSGAAPAPATAPIAGQ